MIFRDDPEGLALRGTVAGAQRQIAYRSVQAMILTRRLQGPIFERRLSEQISVPRKAVHGALLLLEKEGLVVRGDNRAFATRQIDRREFLDSMAVRIMLEGEATYRATGRIPPARITATQWATRTLWTPIANHQTLWRLDDEFHTLIGNHCGNALLAETIRSLRVASVLCTSVPFERLIAPDRLEASRAEHLLILDALERRDPQGARKLMVEHIRSLVQSQLTP